MDTSAYVPPVRYSLVVNDGGPNIVLPDQIAGVWKGTPDGLMRGDYGRACNVQPPGALLAVGASHGLVVHSPTSASAMSTAVGADGSFDVIVEGGGGRGGILSDASLSAASAAFDAQASQPFAEDWLIEGGVTMVFAGDTVGSVAYANPRLAVPSGRYSVRCFEYQLADGSAGAVFRVSPRR